MTEHLKMKIYIVSDSIGETAELVAKAAVSQFDGGNAEYIRYPHINSEERLEEILSEICTSGAMVFYTLLIEKFSKKIRDACTEAGVPAVDVLGPAVKALSEYTGLEPSLQPGLIRMMDARYFKKIEAIEFSVKFDDGKDPRGVLEADIVLIGISRTSKTPISMFLATKGYKVANIPLVPEAPVPKELDMIPSSKIIGLKIDCELLLKIRQERLLTMGVSGKSDYADMLRIYEELEYSEQVMRKIGCRRINVSNKAIEENAAKILEIYRRNNEDA